ncbi:MAG: aspartyl/asparaginyl beta-hydroxylase domain-containing protein [Byssovorax sp.]
MARLDVTRLSALVTALLGPLYGAPDGPFWAKIEERKRWIGREDRPADVGFRRMRPRGYAQIAIVNEEDPPAPWTVPLPADLPRRDELLAAIDEVTAVCERLYGPGRLHFCVLAVLAPGGQVPVHRDMPHASHRKAHSHHLLIPLVDAPRVFYDVAGDDFTMDLGGVYEINNMAFHSVTNRGDRVRVNLMIDYCPASRLALLDEGERPRREGQGSSSSAHGSAGSAGVSGMAAPMEVPFVGGPPLTVDVDSVAIKNVVLVPGKKAAEVYLARIFPIYDGALLVSATADYPADPGLRARALEALATDREIAVFVFGWDALAAVPVATDRICVADEMLASPMARAPVRKVWATSFDERTLVAWMRSFFAQFDRRTMLGDSSFYYRSHVDWDQDRFDWRMDLLLADPVESSDPESGS